MNANFLKYFAVSFVLLLTFTLANSQEKNKGVEKVQDDMKVLKGDWICKKQQWNGGPEDNVESVKTMNKRLNFDKSVMIAKWIGGAGNLKHFEGKFDLDPTTIPKQFDFTGKDIKDPKGKDLVWRGIYELSQNEFKLMIVENGKRPSDLKSQIGIYMLFKRDIE